MPAIKEDKASVAAQMSGSGPIAANCCASTYVRRNKKHKTAVVADLSGSGHNIKLAEGLIMHKPALQLLCPGKEALQSSQQQALSLITNSEIGT